MSRRDPNVRHYFFAFTDGTTRCTPNYEAGGLSLDGKWFLVDGSEGSSLTINMANVKFWEPRRRGEGTCDDCGR